VQLFYFREQADRCRRLARGCTDTTLRDDLLELADEYTARAVPMENPNAGPDDQGTA
jgi:hypothetical protein